VARSIFKQVRFKPGVRKRGAIDGESDDEEDVTGARGGG